MLKCIDNGMQKLVIFLLLLLQEYKNTKFYKNIL